MDTVSNWKRARIPGRVMLSTRQRLIDANSDTRVPLLVEEIVLESLPVELDPYESERLYPRRRK